MPTTPKPSTPSHFARSFSAILRSPMTVMSSHSLKRSRSVSLPPSSPHAPLPPVILQTYSISTDSIVLTALPAAPFCCHEDLLTMPRRQLEAVVRALNERLPRRLRIGIEDDEEEADGIAWISEPELRKQIEELVGIRPAGGTTTTTMHRPSHLSSSSSFASRRLDAPPAPKPTRTRSAVWRVPETAPWETDDAHMDDNNMIEDDETAFTDTSVQSSPLAAVLRERTYSSGSRRRSSNTLSKLAILTEENEGEGQMNEDVGGEDGVEGEEEEEEEEDASLRALKRRRVSSDDGGVENRNENHQALSPAPAAADPTSSHIVPTPQGSRFLENMDASGSPSIVIDDDTNASLVGPNTTMREVTGSANPPDVFVPGEEDDDHVLPPPSCTALPRRRSSARIRQQRVQHQRASSAELTRAKTVLSSADKPREFVIRLPFTSNTTPPVAATNPVVAARDSSPRVLRSHSRRSTGATPFLNMEETDGKKKKKGVLMRSRSERLPQVETPFVTIHRPRYRFGRRKSKRAKSEDEVRV